MYYFEANQFQDQSSHAQMLRQYGSYPTMGTGKLYLPTTQFPISGSSIPRHPARPWTSCNACLIGYLNWNASFSNPRLRPGVVWARSHEKCLTQKPLVRSTTMKSMGGLAMTRSPRLEDQQVRTAPPLG